MMANFLVNHHIISISRRFLADSNYPRVRRSLLKQRRWQRDCSKVSSISDGSNSALVQQCPRGADEEIGMMIDQTAEVEIIRKTSIFDDVNDDDEIEYLVREYGWKVRKMVEEISEIRKVAQIQAQAFHIPALFFDDFFFQFFQAEVLSGLLYRLRNSPPDRYACLVAKPAKEDENNSEDYEQLVGVVDVTVLRDNDVLQHLDGVQEYLYISGIAVSKNYRRQKVATVLLKACEVISVIWGYKCLVLRAYEDDWGARSLYENAGFRLVSRDPPWITWIGRKRRILMIKRLYLS